MAELWRQAAVEALRRAIIPGPVTLAHGGESTVYVDKWRLLGDPADMRALVWALDRLDMHLPLPYGSLRHQRLPLAAPELGAVPFAAMLALMLERPLIVVRRAAKDHGANQGRLTLPISPGQRILLVEDVITSGQTALDAIAVLRDAGAVVEHCLCLVDREADGRETLAGVGVSLWSVALLSELLA